MIAVARSSPARDTTRRTAAIVNRGKKHGTVKDRGGDHPKIGDRVERRRAGVSQYGTVHYADQLQALIKWDNGSSSGLRLDREHVRVIERAPEVIAGTAAGEETLAFSA